MPLQHANGADASAFLFFFLLDFFRTWRKSGKKTELSRPRSRTRNTGTFLRPATNLCNEIATNSLLPFCTPLSLLFSNNVFATWHSNNSAHRWRLSSTDGSRYNISHFQLFHCCTILCPVSFLYDLLVFLPVPHAVGRGCVFANMRCDANLDGLSNFAYG